MSNDIVLPKMDWKQILMAVVALLVISGVMTSVYTIPPDSEGVITRFGKFDSSIAGRITGPGLHFKLPFGIDRVTKVPTRRQESVTFGKNDRNQSLMVTGDLNSALVEWVIQYRVSQPADYIFNVKDPIETLIDASESVMRQVVGDRTVDEVLTIGRQEIQVESLRLLQEIINEYQMGLEIRQVVLQDIKPPDRRVEDAFRAVNQAEQDRGRLINEARAEYERDIPKARGEAQQRIQEAEGYRAERVNRAEGDAARFNSVLAEYLKAPDVTRRRIYLETMSEILPKLGDKIVIDEDAKQILPLLQLGTGKGGVQ